jgi:hypothetical protein
MRLQLLVLSLVAVACGPGRDPKFTSIVQFSAVDKLQMADAFIYYPEFGVLKRVAKTEGAMPQIVHPSGVLDFAVAPGHAYAVTPSGVLHFALATNGLISAPTTISTDGPLAIAADRYGVSWATCSRLTHARPDGTEPIVEPMPGGCSLDGLQLTLDSSTAYGVDARGEWYASRSGGPITPFANEPCERIAAAGGCHGSRPRRC